MIPSAANIIPGRRNHRLALTLLNLQADRNVHDGLLNQSVRIHLSTSVRVSFPAHKHFADILVDALPAAHAPQVLSSTWSEPQHLVALTTWVVEV